MGSKITLVSGFLFAAFVLKLKSDLGITNAILVLNLGVLFVISIILYHGITELRQDIRLINLYTEDLDDIKEKVSNINYHISVISSNHKNL